MECLWNEVRHHVDRFWNNHSDKICKDMQCHITAVRREDKQLSDNSIRASVETKGIEKNAIPSGRLLLCCSLNLHCLKCLAAELVDTEVPCDAYEANKFHCQPGAESLYWCSNEPGENVKQGKMKQTVWSISCSTSWLTNSSSEPQWKSWLTSGAGWTGAEQRLRDEMGYQVEESSGIFTKKHVWNIQFSTDQQLPFSSLDWIILYGNAIMLGIITCSPGDLVYSSCLLLTMTGALPREQPRELISDNPWFTSSSPPLFSDTSANQLKGRVWQLLTSYSI